MKQRRNHDGFVDRLKRGNVCEQALAHRLCDEGFLIQWHGVLTEGNIRPTRSEAKYYSDNGYDIRFMGKRGKFETIEVRSRSEAFEAPEDWPYEDIYFCRPGDMKKVTPDWYAVVSQVTHVPMMVWGPSSESWTLTEPKWNRDQKKKVRYYQTPISQCMSWEDWLFEVRGW